ncbi:MAG: hypothetical protein V6Z86_05155 [Hyphomicrobiales bacterium]
MKTIKATPTKSMWSGVAIMACAMLAACAAGAGKLPKGDPHTNIPAGSLGLLLSNHVEVKYSRYWRGTPKIAAHAHWFSSNGVVYDCYFTKDVQDGQTTPVTYTLFKDNRWRVYDDPWEGALLCAAKNGEFDPKHRKGCAPITWDPRTGHLTEHGYFEGRWQIWDLGHVQATFPAGLAKQCPGLPKSVPINKKQTSTVYKVLLRQDPDAVLTGAKLGIKNDPKWADQVEKWQQW